MSVKCCLYLHDVALNYLQMCCMRRALNPPLQLKDLHNCSTVFKSRHNLCVCSRAQLSLPRKCYKRHCSMTC